MEEKLNWVEVFDRRDLPGIGVRCLFEARGGFRFYGVRETVFEIRMLFSGREVSWLCVKRWAVDGTGSGD